MHANVLHSYLGPCILTDEPHGEAVLVCDSGQYRPGDVICRHGVPLPMWTGYIHLARPAKAYAPDVRRWIDGFIRETTVAMHRGVPRQQCWSFAASADPRGIEQRLGRNVA